METKDYRFPPLALRSNIANTSFLFTLNLTLLTSSRNIRFCQLIGQHHLELAFGGSAVFSYLKVLSLTIPLSLHV